MRGIMIAALVALSAVVGMDAAGIRPTALAGDKQELSDDVRAVSAVAESLLDSLVEKGRAGPRIYVIAGTYIPPNTKNFGKHEVSSVGKKVGILEVRVLTESLAKELGPKNAATWLRIRNVADAQTSMGGKCRLVTVYMAHLVPTGKSSVEAFQFECYVSDGKQVVKQRQN